MTSAQRQAKWREKLRQKGVAFFSLRWPNSECPELRELGDFLIQNPDVSFIPAYRDARGRIRFMKEHR
jgi:hypothetical protein